jgi:hypothetical protein
MHILIRTDLPLQQYSGFNHTRKKIPGPSPWFGLFNCDSNFLLIYFTVLSAVIAGSQWKQMARIAE